MTFTKTEHALLAKELWNLTANTEISCLLHRQLEEEEEPDDSAWHRSVTAFAHALTDLCVVSMDAARAEYGLDFAAPLYVREGALISGLGGGITGDWVHAANKASDTKYCPRCRKVMPTVCATEWICPDCEVELG